MTPHTVVSFDSELAALYDILLDMGMRASYAVTFATDALKTCNGTMAKQVIAADLSIDEFQRRIEENAIGMIARRQPVASDLRQLVACIRIATDFERIGDLAKKRKQRTPHLSEAGTQSGTTSRMTVLSDRVHEAMSDVLVALRTRDDSKAMSVWHRDYEIDALHTSLFREVLTYMMEDPRNIGTCAHLLFCAKNLERIGDHATNIAEKIHYMVSGQAVLADRPRADLAGEQPDDLPLPTWKG